jgi:hypothetical protein
MDVVANRSAGKTVNQTIGKKSVTWLRSGFTNEGGTLVPRNRRSIEP